MFRMEKWANGEGKGDLYFPLSTFSVAFHPLLLARLVAHFTTATRVFAIFEARFSSHYANDGA